jgi:2-amino-4-hydroxy-6-hydroxymethyldihydropteridine diphosphokinase
MPEQHTAAVALGSNLSSALGGPAENLREALRRMAALGEVVAVSGFHATEPVGYVDQPMFVNAAALLRTELAPLELLRALMEIETAMGRVRVVAKGPRVIDLDLLLYEDAVMQTAELVLPHPAMQERAFVLGPLAEIAPGMVHPVVGRSVTEMLRELQEL